MATMRNFSSSNFTKNNLPITSVHTFGLSMEENFQAEKIFDRVQKYWSLTFPLVIVYVMAIHLGVRFMKNRPKFNLRGPLFVWNASLTFVYAFGLYRVLPELIFYLKRGGFYHLACSHCPFGCTQVGYFWLWQFVVMKIPELLDTVFVVLRKQPLFFLHWYHHCTVLVFTFFLSSSMSAPGHVFALVNGVVHALMYFYYSLKSLSIRVPRFVSMTLTLVQISQMVVGVFTICYAHRMQQMGYPCVVSQNDKMAAVVIYASYFFLFSWYFYQAYVVKNALIIAKFKGKKIE